MTSTAGNHSTHALALVLDAWRKSRVVPIDGGTFALRLGSGEHVFFHSHFATVRDARHGVILLVGALIGALNMESVDFAEDGNEPPPSRDTQLASDARALNADFAGALAAQLRAVATPFDRPCDRGCESPRSCPRTPHCQAVSR